MGQGCGIYEGDHVGHDVAAADALLAAPSRSLRTQPAPHRVVRAYLEFVERRPLPAHAGLPPEALAEAQRRDGFEASSADNIFASTTLAARAM